MATKAPSRVTSLLAVLFAVVLLATACGDDGGGEATTETTVAPAEDGATTTTVAAGEAPSELPAASLLADLTALLEEQVYLTGITTETAAVADGDLDAPIPTGFEAAAAESATELSDAIGAVYGAAAGVEFNEAWDAWRTAILAYGLNGGSQQQVATAREGVADVLTGLDEEADFSAVTSGLGAAESLLLPTIRELAAGDPAAAVDLRAAAEEMPEVAFELASVLVDTRGIEGTLDDDSVVLRADLTGLLQESALLTGLALEETVQTGGDPGAPGPAGVLDALAENSAAIAQTMEPDDAAAASELQTLLDDRIDFFVDYTVATLNGDARGIEEAQARLDQLRDDIGTVLAEDYPAFTAPAVAEELVPHVETILAYADAVVEESEGGDAAAEPTSPELLREAALATRLTARTLAAGLSAGGAEE